MSRAHRRVHSVRAWQCDPRRGGRPGPVNVRLVAAAPGPARLRERLSPTYSPEEAAVLANAALADALRAVEAMPIGHCPPGWATVTGGLEESFGETGGQDGPSLLVSMETPQLSADLLADAAGALRGYDAVLGATTGDGWWAFGLRDPAHWIMLRMMAESVCSTGSLTLATLRLGLRVAMLPMLQEVRTGADADAVARRCPPDSRFAAAVARFAPDGPHDR